MAADGLKKTGPDELSQGRKVARRAHFDSLAQHFKVPAAWFEAPDFADWISRAESPPPGVAEIHAMVLEMYSESVGLSADEALAEVRQRAPKPSQTQREQQAGGRDNG